MIRRFRLSAFIFSLCLSLYVLSSWAQSQSKLPDDFNLANGFYEQGDYSRAQDLYQSLIKSGYRQAGIYYNLANCYFRQQQLGQAAFYYETARRQAPRDSDIRFNLKYLQSLLVNTEFKNTSSFLTKLFESSATILSLDEIVILGTAFFYLLVIFILIKLVFRQRKTVLDVLTAFSFLVFVYFLISFISLKSRYESEAIVINDASSANFEPRADATSHFNLYQGMTVRVIDSFEEWSKISRADGKLGWVKNSDLKRFNICR
ncbi:MAG: tetratricopeptide repeat protein [Candidatus Omnitrophica bacterium]|nr:tetratricopeptide repeat protein [Candidatus Omnitrophota bacterium]